MKMFLFHCTICESFNRSFDEHTSTNWLLILLFCFWQSEFYEKGNNENVALKWVLGLTLAIPMKTIQTPDEWHVAADDNDTFECSRLT